MCELVPLHAKISPHSAKINSIAAIELSLQLHNPTSMPLMPVQLLPRNAPEHTLVGGMSGSIRLKLKVLRSRIVYLQAGLPAREARGTADKTSLDPDIPTHHSPGLESQVISEDQSNSTSKYVIWLISSYLLFQRAIYHLLQANQLSCSTPNYYPIVQ